MTAWRAVRFECGRLALTALAALYLLLRVAPDPRPLPVLPPPAPPVALLRLASGGEPALAARWLAFDLLRYERWNGRIVPYERWDYRRLAARLDAMHALDPRWRLPAMLAAGVYVEVRDPARAALLLDRVAAWFEADPARFWPELAQAAVFARHRLGDWTRARAYAARLRRAALAGAPIPAWARDLEVLLLMDLGEREAAALLIEALLRGDAVRDPGERRWLEARLRALRAPGR